MGSIGPSNLRKTVIAAVVEDDEEIFMELRAHWDAVSAPIRAGPRCARLALAEGVRVHPDSLARVQQIFEMQTVAAIVLRRFFSIEERSITLDIFRRADFYFISRD
eukprot:TRINITY_DN1889_c0_g1_i2.p2 TRINITY_DN1889_c0_g1~~TRINITY_DN1889_c0_g1_i2.p2  ORF type:complete len:106 (-),score=6.44 TRINITY_DN1889_c0_g1_i2:171-488(-)